MSQFHELSPTCVNAVPGGVRKAGPLRVEERGLTRRLDNTAGDLWMKQVRKARVRAQLTGLLVAALLAEAVALGLTIASQATIGNIPPAAFGASGGLTILLARRWVLVDARKAFSAAVERHQALVEGTPPQIIYMARACPRRWLVVLHVQLHPELIDADVE